MIILFSHCIQNSTPNEQVEFFNGMIKSDDVFSSIPIQASCIYDLAVCNCEYLFRRLQEERRQSVSGYSSENIPLCIWLVIYAEVFYNMIVRKHDFLDAVDEVFRRAKKNRNNFLKQ